MPSYPCTVPVIHTCSASTAVSTIQLWDFHKRYFGHYIPPYCDLHSSFSATSQPALRTHHNLVPIFPSSIMPEMRECIAHFLFLLWFLQYCLENGIDLRLLDLWADASKTEEKSLAPDGLVYCLDALSTVYRGTCGAQSSLWPPMWRKVKGKPDPPLIQSLKWEAVSFSNRAIVMNLGPLHFQVSR